jgi:hypothetical protein
LKYQETRFDHKFYLQDIATSNSFNAQTELYESCPGFLSCPGGSQKNISCFVANCFPDPEAVLPGVAELIVNAVEHGNLSISYEEKTALHYLVGGERK